MMKIVNVKPAVKKILGDECGNGFFGSHSFLSLLEGFTVFTINLLSPFGSFSKLVLSVFEGLIRSCL